MEKEKNIEIELERAKLSNYILKKENDILLGTIGIMARDKEALISELEDIKKSTFVYKFKKVVKKLIGRK